MQQSSAIFVLVIRSNVTEDSVLLRHDSASVGNHIPLFQGSTVSSSSGVKTSENYSWLFSIYVWAHCVASQCWNPFTIWHRIMSQKKGNLRVETIAVCGLLYSHNTIHSEIFLGDQSCEMKVVFIVLETSSLMWLSIILVTHSVLSLWCLCPSKNHVNTVGSHSHLSHTIHSSNRPESWLPFVHPTIVVGWSLLAAVCRYHLDGADSQSVKFCSLI